MPRRRRIRVLRLAGREAAFTLLEILVVLTVIAIVAAVAIPSVLAARIRSNEEAAVATLHLIADAEARFRADAKVDLDRDGDPEFGYLKEMAATVGVRTSADGSSVGEPASPPSLPPGFGALEPAGELVRLGYRFRVFLPGAAAVGVGETQSFPLEASVDAKLAATAWCCYAWPTRRGTSGGRTFFVNQTGRVVGAECDDYSGPGRFQTEDCGAAFARGVGTLATMTGLVASGTRGRDGNWWRRAY